MKAEKEQQGNRQQRDGSKGCNCWLWTSLGSLFWELVPDAGQAEGQKGAVKALTHPQTQQILSFLRKIKSFHKKSDSEQQEHCTVQSKKPLLGGIFAVYLEYEILGKIEFISIQEPKPETIQ